MDYVGKGRLVPKAGFEPAHPQGALDPESSASASFATSAWIVLNGVKELQ